MKKDEIEYIAWKTRIKLSEEEKERLEKELSPVLDFFALLDELDTTDIEPRHHVIGITDVVREDETKDELKQSEVLRNVPRKENGYIISPRIL